MSGLLRCVGCQKLTNKTEAEYRLFNTGHCAYCNGELKELPEPEEE